MKKHLANGKINTIGVNPFSKRVYMGTKKPIKEGSKAKTWSGGKVDVTKEYVSFLPVLIPEISTGSAGYECGKFWGSTETGGMKIAIVNVDMTKKNSLKKAINFFEKHLKGLK